MSDGKKAPFFIEDSSILTLQEHKLIGSGTFLAAMGENPFVPQAVLEGKTPKDVAILRIRQKEIVSPSAAPYFGLKHGKSAVINLNMIDMIRGEVSSKQPRLSGIYDETSGQIIRDPELLVRYQLNDEGKRMFLVEDEVGRREKIG